MYGVCESFKLCRCAVSSRSHELLDEVVSFRKHELLQELCRDCSMNRPFCSVVQKA